MPDGATVRDRSAGLTRPFPTTSGAVRTGTFGGRRHHRHGPIVALMRLLRPITDPRFVLDPARQGRELAFFLRWLTPVVLGFAIVELIGAVAFDAWGPALTGITFAVFAIWCRFIVRPSLDRGSVADQAFAVALGMLGIHIVAVVTQPTEFGVLAAATSLAVLFALAYVDRARLFVLMALAGASSVACVAVIVLTEGASPFPRWLSDSLAVAAMVAAAGIATLLLYQFAGRFKDALGELSGLAAMSRDLAQTLDPAEVGQRMAHTSPTPWAPMSAASASGMRPATGC